MILADKIIDLRKKNGWSQEELAERLNVTRQSVSKWEGAQSVPDLDKILQLSHIFGVSTDYLLKDELDAEEHIPGQEPASSVRRVSIQEASEFLAVKEATAPPIAFAVFLCILSPVCLLLLGGAFETGRTALSENAAGGIGLVVLFLMVAAAVAIFIFCGSKTGRFEYLDKEIIETEYGVAGLAKERQKQLHSSRTVHNVLGTCLCILSVVPLFVALCLTEDPFVLTASIAALLLMVGIGVFLFIRVGIPWESTQKLLQEGDYTRRNKVRVPMKEAVTTVYWLLVVAGFLAYCLPTDHWEAAGVIFAVAGILYAAIMVLWRALDQRNGGKSDGYR